MNTNVVVVINNNMLERVYKNMFLGVILDHNLCWKAQMNHVRSKLARIIGVLGKIRYILNHKTLYILYCSYITEAHYKQYAHLKKQKGEYVM